MNDPYADSSFPGEYPPPDPPPPRRSVARRLALGCAVVLLVGCVVGLVLGVVRLVVAVREGEIQPPVTLPGVTVGADPSPTPEPTAEPSVVITNENINELLGRRVVEDPEPAGSVRLLPPGGRTLDIGMTEAQVRALLGPPHSVAEVATNEPTRTGGMVSWVYERTVMREGVPVARPVTVIFRDGVVVDVAGLEPVATAEPGS